MKVLILSWLVTLNQNCIKKNLYWQKILFSLEFFNLITFHLGGILCLLVSFLEFTLPSLILVVVEFCWIHFDLDFFSSLKIPLCELTVRYYCCTSSFLFWSYFSFRSLSGQISPFPHLHRRRSTSWDFAETAFGQVAFQNFLIFNFDFRSS